MSQFNYGAVGNCRTAALISEKGSVDWFCFPDFDSPSVFGKLLDEEKGGSFSFLVDDQYTISQHYIEHTNILSTFFESEEGNFEVIDFMPRYKMLDYNHYLPPELYRIIRLKKGKPRFKVLYEPAMDYARNTMRHEIGTDYIKSFPVSEKYDTIFLYSSLDYNRILACEEFELTQDEFLLVSYNQKLIPIHMDRVDLEFQRTRVYWRNWANRSKKYTQYNSMIERSMLVLKLMSYQRTGAVLAALTTSLPESIGGVRNWDYRFCWIRDASMSIETLVHVGHKGAAERFISFLNSILISKADKFQIMYGIRGERVLTEYELPHLKGFKNSRPVRIGNDAYKQKQNDSFGYLMNVIYQYYHFFQGTLDEIEDMFQVVNNIIRTVQQDWRKPDKGIWEIRGEEKHFVLSKIMCWVAFDRAVSIARLLNQQNLAEKWELEANAIKKDVFTHGWKEKEGFFSQTYCNAELDSSLLLMEVYGFIDADDPRYVKTVNAIYAKLLHNGLMFRYNNQDDFGIPTSAFTICTFWMVRALYVTGRKNEAEDLFEQLLSYSNHLGLFSEDLDFETKEQLGNFPQAYSHLALINTAILFGEEENYSQFIRP
ncbi:MAG: glycoside hydrolase family 15 protein [Massilibacteroides sp.]|nr:glycoside hydrolase family 15 protein [Massilibacteroides sp.]MDD3061378.1 glycoside hydrolase family 15 protein [Massilibacteroides sp.]MDD4114895.1 glycoside hydrolase family 15 protein [Massilibacteroides sp.]MDD4659469.1 glycoside hydrolase family 15 protein [Massilibacteroides sp.]